MEDLLIDITVDNGSPNALSPNSIEFKCGRSFITNEEYQKLDESILIVDNLGRFFNSNPPE